MEVKANKAWLATAAAPRPSSKTYSSSVKKLCSYKSCSASNSKKNLLPAAGLVKLGGRRKKTCFSECWPEKKRNGDDA